MTLVILDTCCYLRLAYRIRQVLNQPFGQKPYSVHVLKDVEDEVHRQPRLRAQYPWFDREEFKADRLASRLRLTVEEKDQLGRASRALRDLALADEHAYKNLPSIVDCRVLALAQLRDGIAVTDDEAMHTLARSVEIRAWHGCDLLHKLLSARVVDKAKVTEIFDALERNQDLTAEWKRARTTLFASVFRGR